MSLTDSPATLLRTSCCVTVRKRLASLLDLMIFFNAVRNDRRMEEEEEQEQEEGRKQGRGT